MLARTAALIDAVSTDFERFEFYRFFQALQNFCVVDLSNVYLDIAKDRLYVSGADDFRRRSCQTVLSLVLERLAGLIAPVLCHMAEDIWQNLPYPVAESSVFGRGWPTVPADWHPGTDSGYSLATHAGIRDLLMVVRPVVNRQLDACRQAGSLGASLEACVQLAFDDNDLTRPLLTALQELGASRHPAVDNLADWLLVSQLQIGGPPLPDGLAEAHDTGMTVRVSRAAGDKCDRCWHYETDVAEHQLAAGVSGRICGRCRQVLEPGEAMA
jgi:isoleucyl-tRNA synthetase